MAHPVLIRDLEYVTCSNWMQCRKFTIRACIQLDQVDLGSRNDSYQDIVTLYETQSSFLGIYQASCSRVGVAVCIAGWYVLRGQAWGQGEPQSAVRLSENDALATRIFRLNIERWRSTSSK